MEVSYVAALSSKGDQVSLSFWPKGKSAAGIHADVRLSLDEARGLIQQIESALRDAPRIGTAADLGCDDLP